MHYLEEVKERFIKNAATLSESAIDRFHSKALSDLSMQSSLTNPENQKLPNLYFNTFNQMFFFDALHQNLCTFRMVLKNGPNSTEWQANYTAQDRLAGYTQSIHTGFYNSEKRQAKITLFEKLCADTTYRLEHYLETMLHEMVPAFIMIYTCCCPSCTDIFALQYGQKGHGRTWHAMATILEEVVNEKLGINVFLGIADGMAEWYLTGADLQEVDLGNLGRRNMVKRVEDLHFYNGSPG